MSEAPEKEISHKKRVRQGLVGAAILAALGAPWAARSLVLHFATRASVDTLEGIADSLPDSDEKDLGDHDLMFPLWPLDSVPAPDALAPSGHGPAGDLPTVEDVEKGLPNHRKLKKKLKKKTLLVAPIGPAPTNARASVDRVLGWAEKELVPQGISRGASAEIPAGIELYGVGALGLGLLDGDRLISVDGSPVLERGEVIGAVLAARSRRAVAMTAKLVRRTEAGPVEFVVVVEQPYPEHLIPEEPDPAPDATAD